MQQKEKVRIFALARELDMESKDLLNLCRQHGIDVKNQLSTIEPEVRDRVVQLVRQKATGPAATGARGGGLPPVPPPRVPDLGRPKVLPARGPRPHEPPAAPASVEPTRTSPVSESAPLSPEKPAVASPAPTPPAPPTAAPTPAPQAHATPPAPPRPAEQPPEARPAPTPPAPPVPPPPQVKAPEAPPTPSRPPERTPEPPPAPPRPAQPPAPAAGPTPPPARPPEPPPAPRTPPAVSPPPVPRIGPRPMPNLGGARGDSGPRRPLRPGGPRPGSNSPIRVAAPPPARPPLKTPEKKPEKPAGPRKLMDIPPEMANQAGPITVESLLRSGQQPPASPVKPGVPGVAPTVEEEEEEDRKGAAGKGHKRGPGVVAGRDRRHRDRDQRQQQRKEGEGRRAGGTLVDEEEVGNRLKNRIRHRQKHAGPQPRKGKVPLEVPITVRSLSEAVGVKSSVLLTKLMGMGVIVNINANLDPDTAEALALEQGVELEIKRPLNPEEELLERFKQPDEAEDLVPRAPIVTVMGHVDHGKTSLLDRIRKSNVAATEAGGITQVIRAWRVVRDGRPITFLDTPGHEAFTKMRARGAHVTDIAVIVVAADDGVMPQTEEAINHAKAAGVSIVVAINKVDLPNANLRRTEQQLYGMGLIPDTMGGDVPFVQTSAATGKGIDDLLENILVVAELKELKANPNKPASGTCLEAHLSEREGVLGTLLVQDGTLKPGDVVLCGAGYGTVRRLYDDLGRPIQTAGPSVPVRITGLDEVPNADDPFLVVPELATAREIAGKRKSRLQEASLSQRRPVTLESLRETQVTELKIILKADARGSIEAIRAEMEKFHHEEVRLRLLHAAIGGITVSDVQLALTSPEDTLIVGFNAVPDDAAKQLADERGIQLREYNIIYNLVNDIRSALEGKLKPREEVVHLGRAIVRETFKISRVGTIAGCYVTQGVLERSARVRVIRNGVVVFPPPDRTVGLESLKRFKEDAREVREGFECGLKIAGYDDIKVDDVIEAYRVEQVMRTLS